VVILLMNVSNQDNIGFNLGQALSVIALGEEYKLPEKKKRISLHEDELKKFEGQYELSNGLRITATSVGDYLTLEPAEIKGMKYYPYSKTEFYAEGSEYRKIKFILDKEGNVVRMTMEECVFSIIGKKV
jgi:hypothetical protein